MDLNIFRFQGGAARQYTAVDFIEKVLTINISSIRKLSWLIKLKAQ